MSGIRDHKIFQVTIEGVAEHYPRDSMGDLCGELIRTPRKSVMHIVASKPGIAEAHVRSKIQFSGWATEPPPIVTIDKGTTLDAFIEEHIY